jgi:hypothetical protein
MATLFLLLVSVEATSSAMGLTALNLFSTVAVASASSSSRHNAAAAAVVFSNVHPRRDTAGNIIDAHDGNYELVNGTWYYWAMGYGLCNDTGKSTAAAQSVATALPIQSVCGPPLTFLTTAGRR